MIHRQGSFEDSACINKVDSVPEQNGVIKQGQTSCLKSDDKCSKEITSTSSHNEVQDVSPDLFSNIETEKQTDNIVSKTISNPGDSDKALIENNLSASLTQDKLSTDVADLRYNCDNELEKSEINNSNNSNNNETTVDSTTSVFDEMMKDLQEKTFDKFKGSILDCLF